MYQSSVVGMLMKRMATCANQPVSSSNFACGEAADQTLRFAILPPIAFTLEKLFAKNLPKIRASLSTRTQMFHVFFVGAGAKRKTLVT